MRKQKMEFIIRYPSCHRPLRCSSVPRQRTDNFPPGPDSKRRTADLRRPTTLLGCSDLSQPPSTLISRHVMYDAYWEARNVTVLATRLGAQTSRLLRSQITHQFCLASAQILSMFARFATSACTASTQLPIAFTASSRVFWLRPAIATRALFLQALRRG